MGKGIKAKSRSAALVEAKFKCRHHGCRAEMPLGDFQARESDGVVAKNASVNKGQSNHDMRLVQQGRDGGLEAYLPGDNSKPQRGLPSLDKFGVDGVGPPLVDIPIRQTNGSKGKDFQLESSIADISGVKLE